MIEIQGNIFDSGFTHLIHGCNCQGGFGAGFAKSIRELYPQVYQEYKQFVNSVSPRINLLGQANIVELDGKVFGNLFTQEFYGPGDKRYASPNAICEAILEFISKVPTDIIHMPRIGAGLGGLNWETEVKPILLEIEEDYPVEFHVYYL